MCFTVFLFQRKIEKKYLCICCCVKYWSNHISPFSRKETWEALRNVHAWKIFVCLRVKMSVWFSFSVGNYNRSLFFPPPVSALFPFARKYDRDHLVASCNALSYVWCTIWYTNLCCWRGFLPCDARPTLTMKYRTILHYRITSHTSEIPIFYTYVYKKSKIKKNDKFNDKFSRQQKLISRKILQ